MYSTTDTSERSAKDQGQTRKKKTTNNNGHKVWWLQKKLLLLRPDMSRPFGGQHSYQTVLTFRDRGVYPEGVLTSLGVHRGKNSRKKSDNRYSIGHARQPFLLRKGMLCTCTAMQGAVRHALSISRMKNQQRHGTCWMPAVENKQRVKAKTRKTHPHNNFPS